MDNKEHGEPPHLEGPNNRNDDGCIYCPCFGDAVCLECQEMAELRARWTRNERDDSDRDTPLDIDDESDTSLDLNDIENVDETCTGGRNASACRISRERAELDRSVFCASYSNLDETCTGARNVSACRISSERADLSAFCASYSNLDETRTRARNVIAFCARNVSLYGVTMKGLKYKPIIPDDISERDNDTESVPEMPELEETNENKEDSDEDSDLPPLEVM